MPLVSHTSHAKANKHAGYGPGTSASCQNAVWSAVTGACSRGEASHGAITCRHKRSQGSCCQSRALTLTLCNSLALHTRTPTASAVCTGTPPAINNAVWPPSCTGGTPVNARCQGACPSGSNGSPSIRCVASGWDVTSVAGRCVAGPGASRALRSGPATLQPAHGFSTCVRLRCALCAAVCSTMPPSVLNAQWPTACMDTAVGGSCAASASVQAGTCVNPACSRQRALECAHLLTSICPLLCRAPACRTNYGPGATATCTSGGTWTISSGACFKGALNQSA
jgi:hypothetical protein